MSGAVVTITGQLPVRLHGGPGSPGDRPTGGLTAFLVEEMRARPGSFWFAARRPDLTPIYGSTRRRSLDGVEAVEFEVPAHDWRDHTTFCAGALWPIAHGFPARTVLRRTEEQAYRRFNARLSAALRPLLKPRDLVWVHDYQPLLIARVLRRLGFTGRIGLLLHAPFPPLDAWRILPGASEFLVDMLDYDLVGLSSEGSRDNYLHCVRRSCAAKVGEDRIVSTGRTQRVRVYPGAIDPESFLPSTQAVAATTSDPLPRLVGGRRAVLSLGRMEHAGGIPERIRAFGVFLRHALRRRGKVSLVEIAALGQAPLSERLQVKRDVELATSRVNSEFGDRGWTPVQVVNRLASAELLCSYLRDADVGWMTPLRDEAGLSAQDFIAAQRNDTPAALVMSKFTSVTPFFPQAIHVNPFVPDEAAEGLARALDLTADERRQAHTAMRKRVLSWTARHRGRAFLADLEERTKQPGTP